MSIVKKKENTKIAVLEFFFVSFDYEEIKKRLNKKIALNIHVNHHRRIVGTHKKKKEKNV